MRKLSRNILMLSLDSNELLNVPLQFTKSENVFRVWEISIQMYMKEDSVLSDYYVTLKLI